MAFLWTLIKKIIFCRVVILRSDLIGQIWDINMHFMQSKCKVKPMVLLASSFGDIVYLFINSIMFDAIKRRIKWATV